MSGQRDKQIKNKVTIIGDGNSAHTLIPLLSKSGYEVSLLTENPKLWKKRIQLEYQSETEEVKQVFEGELHNASSDLAKIIEKADFIVFCLAVSQYKVALDKIAPLIDKKKKVYIGTIYGQGGFNWMVDEIKAKYSLDKIVTFAVGLIPWICRTKEYGSIGITYGPKARNVVATDPLNEFEELKSTFLNDLCHRWFKKGEFYQAENFISLTLSVDNQIIHPSRMYALYLANPKKWDKKEDVPLFYKDFDDSSAEILQKLDNDYSKIRERIKADNPDSDFKYMLDYLSLERFSYDSCNENIKASFTDSKTLGLIETPVAKNQNNKWELDKNHRFFTDDIFYGLCIAKWFATQFSLNVPMIDEILIWAQDTLEISLLKSGILNEDCTFNSVSLGTPTKYNLSLKDSFS